MTIKYTDKQVAELKAIGVLDYDSAVAFGEKHGVSHRSVIAKARALEIPYKPKAPGQRADKGPAKDALVKQIEAAFGIELPSMAKMTVIDLNKLLEALG